MRPLLGLVLLAKFACCDAYPLRPLVLVLPFSATGSTDITGVPRVSKLMRVMQTMSAPSLSDVLVHQMQQSLTGALGQPVTVYPRLREKTTAGPRYPAMAPADGYTLLFADSPTITIFPA